MSRMTLPATASALAVLIVGALIVWAHQLGPLSQHMALHIALMNVVAPLAAAILADRNAAQRAAYLWTTAAFQIALLWAWHAPSIQQHVFGSQLALGAMHGSLLIIAFCFWQALLQLAPNARWHAISVLLLTGKLFCLLAVLLIFAPRLLYDSPASEHLTHGASAPTTLADQHLAGLLMVVACPLSYLVAGVIIATEIVRPRSHASCSPPSTVTGP